MPYVIEPAILGKQMLKRDDAFIQAHAVDLRSLGGDWYETSVDFSMGATGTLPTPIDPTGAVEGTPGQFTPANADVPADLVALQALGDLGQAAAWTGGEFVELGDTSHAYWDGGDWVAGEAP